MLSFVIAEEDLRIETSYPFNEVTAVFLLNNPHYHHTRLVSYPWSHCLLQLALVVLYSHELMCNLN